MSILKKINKKKTGMDLKKMAQVIANIKEMIRMELLKVDLSTRKFSIQPALWSNRDLTFKKNWSKTIGVYWNAETGFHGSDGEFQVCDINTGLVLGVISFKNGMKDISCDQDFEMIGVTSLVQ